MDNLVQPVTFPLTRAPTAATGELVSTGIRVPHPPSGFSFVRTTTGNVVRDAARVYMIVPGVST